MGIVGKVDSQTDGVEVEQQEKNLTERQDGMPVVRAGQVAEKGIALDPVEHHQHRTDQGQDESLLVGIQKAPNRGPGPFQFAGIGQRKHHDDQNDGKDRIDQCGQSLQLARLALLNRGGSFHPRPLQQQRLYALHTALACV